MNPIVSPIRDFLLAHHVVGLAVITAEGPWAASCFYAADLAQARLILLTSSDTRHGDAMHRHPLIAGTISGQPEQWREIAGIQLTARAECLDGDDAKAAREIFCERHPIARVGRHTFWALWLESIKHTSNHLIFGQKTLWQRTQTE